jgi:hypothetical protein
MNSKQIARFQQTTLIGLAQDNSDQNLKQTTMQVLLEW